jgi:hypothetical protein
MGFDWSRGRSTAPYHTIGPTGKEGVETRADISQIDANAGVLNFDTVSALRWCALGKPLNPFGRAHAVADHAPTTPRAFVRFWCLRTSDRRHAAVK